MSTIQGPTLPRRRIARELRELRERADLRLEEVARETDVSTSTLSRLENAQGSANALTIRALVDFYNIADTERGQRLVRWAKDGRKQGWWQNFPDAATDNISLYVAYESQAAVVKVYVIPFMPILLQAPEYSRAITEAFHPTYSSAQIERLVRFQQRRQQILRSRDNQPPLKLRAILHESCFRQLVGSRDVMRTQLQHMLDVAATYRNVRLQVLPQSAPPHRAMRCVWSHFEYSDELDGDVTIIEPQVGVLTPLEEPNEVEKTARYFAELSRMSLNTRESVDFIKGMIERQYS
jgi:transcriptional regulator with XRE-family HTH domain